MMLIYIIAAFTWSIFVQGQDIAHRLMELQDERLPLQMNLEDLYLYARLSTVNQNLEESLTNQEMALCLDALRAYKRLIQYQLEKPWRQADGKFWLFLTKDPLSIQFVHHYFDAVYRDFLQTTRVNMQAVNAFLVQHPNFQETAGLRELLGIISLRYFCSQEYVHALHFLEKLVDAALNKPI